MEVELNICSPLPTKPNCQVLSRWLDKPSLFMVTFISGVLYFVPSCKLASTNYHLLDCQIHPLWCPQAPL